MSCELCDKLQDLAFDKNISQSIPIAYVRVGNSDMAIVGCEKHTLELIKELRK